MGKNGILAGMILLAFCICGCKKTSPVSQKKSAVEVPERKTAQAKPWQDGEILKMRVSSLQGEEIGMMSFHIQSETKNQKNFWKIISYNYLSSSDFQQYSEIEADAQNFRPVYSHVVNLLGDFEAKYDKNKIKLISDSVEGKKEKNFDVNDTVFDNEQILHLLRTELLNESYKNSFKIFSAMNGEILDYSVAAAGKEQVVVSAGIFDCYRLNLKMSEAGQEPEEHAIWISTDENRYIVKYIAGMAAIMELSQVSVAEKNTPAVYQNAQLGCGFSLPPNWESYEHLAGPTYFIELLCPELKSKGALGVLPAGDGRNDAREIALSDSENFKTMLEGFTLRDGLKETTVGGIKAVQYIADFKEESNALRKYSQPKDMVEYRTYLVANDKVYFFVFRAEKEKFENLKSEFDGIIQSLELKKS